MKNYFSLFSNRCSTSVAAAIRLGRPSHRRPSVGIPNRGCFDGKKIKSLLLSLGSRSLPLPALLRIPEHALSPLIKMPTAFLGDDVRRTYTHTHTYYACNHPLFVYTTYVKPCCNSCSIYCSSGSPHPLESLAGFVYVAIKRRCSAGCNRKLSLPPIVRAETAALGTPSLGF